MCVFVNTNSKGTKNAPDVVYEFETHEMAHILEGPADYKASALPKNSPSPGHLWLSCVFEDLTLRGHQWDSVHSVHLLLIKPNIDGKHGDMVRIPRGICEKPHEFVAETVFALCTSSTCKIQMWEFDSCRPQRSISADHGSSLYSGHSSATGEPHSLNIKSSCSTSSFPNS